MNSILPRYLPVLITNSLVLCSTQISLKNIWYDVCLDNRDSLPGDDDDGGDDDDTSAISTCAVETTHDVVAEICRKTSYMTMLSCLIYFLKSHFIYIHFLMLQSEIFQQLSLYGHGQQTYFICRWIQHHDIYHINGIKHHIISVISL